MSDIIALTKATTLKEVCLHDVDRGMQLMEGIEVIMPIPFLRMVMFLVT